MAFVNDTHTNLGDSFSNGNPLSSVGAGNQYNSNTSSLVSIALIHVLCLFLIILNLMVFLVNLISMKLFLMILLEPFITSTRRFASDV